MNANFGLGLSDIEPGPGQKTEPSLLSVVISDYTPCEHELGKNCRNIADEVHPGVILGDA